MSRKEVAHLNELIGDLQTQCARHEDSVIRASATVEELQGELKTSEAREDDLEEQLETALSDVHQHCIHIETLELEKKRVEETWMSVTAELEMAKSENEMVKVQLLERDSEMLSLTARCDDTAEQLKLQTEAVTDLKQMMTDLTLERDNLQQHCKQIEIDSDKDQLKIQELHDAVTALEEEKGQMQEKISNSEQELTDTKAQLTSESEKSRDLTAELEKQKSVSAELRDAVTVLEEEKGQLKEQISNSEQELTDTKAQLTSESERSKDLEVNFEQELRDMEKKWKDIVERAEKQLQERELELELTRKELAQMGSLCLVDNDDVKLLQLAMKSECTKPGMIYHAYHLTTFSRCLDGHFPSEPAFASGYWSKG